MKRRTAGSSLILTAAALALWETAARRHESRRFRAGADYWHAYYPATLIDHSSQIRQTHKLHSNGVELHIDCYPVPDPQAPVIIFNHGAAGYSRLFVQLALAWHDRGYTVVLPDQQGQGFSGGRRGDYTIAGCTQNLVDAANWAKARYAGPLYMAGGSVGGALSYYAAAAGAPVQALACLNLFDFGNGRDGLSISRLSALSQSQQIAKWLSKLAPLTRPVQWLSIPFIWLGAFEKLMDAQESDFQTVWQADPVPSRTVSLRSLASNLNTPPRIPFEHNHLPVLVINQAHDRMVDPATTKRSYERLGGPKRYLEIPYEHWSVTPDFHEAIINACDSWFREHGR